MAFVLTLLGLFVYWTTRLSIYAAVDADLQRGAEFFQTMWQNDRFGGPGGPPGGNLGGPNGHRGPRDYVTENKMLGPLFQQQPQQPNVETRDTTFRDPSNKPADQQDSRFGIEPGRLKQRSLEMELSRPRVWRFGSRGRDPGKPWDKDKPWDTNAAIDAKAGEVVLSTNLVNGQRVRFVSRPLYRDGRIDSVVQLGFSLRQADASVGRLGMALLSALPLVLIFTTVAGMYLTGRAMAPVRDIAQAAEAIEASNLSRRLTVTGKDEFASLSNTFNSMLDRLERSFVALAEQNEAQRRFIADASHELKTPLTAIKTRVGIAAAGKKDPDRLANHLVEIGKSANSMASLVQDLLLLARSDDGKMELRRTTVPLEQLIVEAIEAVSPGNARQIEYSGADCIALLVDPPLITRVIINLLSNAVRHTSEEKLVSVECFKSDPLVEIRVIDEGSGISAEHIDHLFERFHRADAARDRESGGTGLGLPIVRSIVEAHGGKVWIESKLARGTTAIVQLPIIPRSEGPASSD